MGGMRTALADAVIAVFPVALVYFSGWAYLTAYLGEFGIDATQIDVSFATVLVYAFVPLQAFWVLSLILLLAVMTLVLFILELYSKDQNSKINKTVASVIAFLSLITAVLFVCLLFVIKSAAVEAAKDIAHNVWKGSKSQTFPTLVNAGNDEKVVVELYRACRDGKRLRQIIGLTGETFLICRSDVDPCNRGTLFLLNKDGRIVYTADKVREDIDAEKICTG